MNGSFSWDPVGDATGYNFYFGEDVIEPLDQIDDNLTSPSMAFPEMEQGTVYYRHVVAHTANGDIEGPYWWFKVNIIPCECDLTHDGRCDMLDWLLFGEDWGRTDCREPDMECECDLNNDGRCDMQDWLMFGEDWGRTDCPIP